jgi:Rps23 Pro-64 3,4-dihydroxylase Tpa1-like proline 4-hydroxylase|tara:strand:+ start:2825 stop:3391 length:567 start_codon:yes stop_codon:yes gene_type:complete
MEVDNFVRVYNAVDKKIISKFLLYTRKTKEFEDAPIETSDGTVVDTKIRDVKTLWLSDDNVSLTNVHWYNYFNNCFIQHIEKYKKDTNSEYMHYHNNFEMNVLKYNKDNFYTWHTDHSFKTPRTMSSILLCNDSYKGGEIVFKLPNEKEFSVECGVGDLLLFPSNFMFAHCVKPVTEGERITVVGWIV